MTFFILTLTCFNKNKSTSAFPFEPRYKCTTHIIFIRRNDLVCTWCSAVQKWTYYCFFSRCPNFDSGFTQTDTWGFFKTTTISVTSQRALGLCTFQPLMFPGRRCSYVLVHRHRFLKIIRWPSVEAKQIRKTKDRRKMVRLMFDQYVVY